MHVVQTSNSDVMCLIPQTLDKTSFNGKRFLNEDGLYCFINKRPQMFVLNKQGTDSLFALYHFIQYYLYSSLIFILMCYFTFAIFLYLLIKFIDSMENLKRKTIFLTL